MNYPLGKFFLRAKGDRTSYGREIWILNSGLPRDSEPYLALLYDNDDCHMIDPFSLKLFKLAKVGEVYETM